MPLFVSLGGPKCVLEMELQAGLALAHGYGYGYGYGHIRSIVVVPPPL